MGREEIHAQFRGAVKEVLTGEDEGRISKIRDVRRIKNQTAVVVARFIYLSVINRLTNLSFKITTKSVWTFFLSFRPTMTLL